MVRKTTPAVYIRIRCLAELVYESEVNAKSVAKSDHQKGQVFRVQDYSVEINGFSG